MEAYISVLRQAELFAGVGEAELATMLGCLDTRVREYRKGEFVFRQGERVSRIAVLLEGELLVQRDDYWGSRSILGRVLPGGMFAEAYLAPESGPIPNDVVAVGNSRVAFFDVNRVITTCSSACRFHTQVVRNLFYAISEKNRSLVRKLGHMARRTIREKLISYLSEEARRQGGGEFTVPFNRQELADYLSVDRSALSNELSKMRAEGLLTYDRNRFTLCRSLPQNGPEWE